MKRKSLMQIRDRGISHDMDDKDTIIRILLKRACNTDEAIEYLLSAVLDQNKDDMIGELASYEANRNRNI